MGLIICVGVSGLAAGPIAAESMADVWYGVVCSRGLMLEDAGRFELKNLLMVMGCPVGWD